MHFKNSITNKMAEDIAVRFSVSSGSCKTSVEDLNNIITGPASGLYMMPSDAYNEVFDGILIGEA